MKKNLYAAIVVLPGFLISMCFSNCKKFGDSSPQNDYNHRSKRFITVPYQPIIDDAFPAATVSADSTAYLVYDDAITTFDNSRWYPGWDEANVFKVQFRSRPGF